MRILIVNSEYPPIGGGAGNATRYVARAMAAAGHEVTVLTSKYRSLPWRETDDGVRIVRAPARRRRMDRSRALEQASFILGGGLRGLLLMFKWKPDVTLAFFGMPSGAVALPLKWVFGVPFIVSLRGGDVPGFRPYDFALYHRMISPLLRMIWRQAGRVVANSEGLRALALAFDREIPVDIIPNGVDPDRFAPPERSWKTPHLLFVGRVVYQKGLDLVFLSLSSLKHLAWDLTVVGDGPQREELELLAQVLGFKERVRFAGWLKDEGLVVEYHRANLFVYPSRHEGMPNAVLESMASGLPVVATRIAGSEELVVDGETGLLVAPEDQPALERALAQMIEDRAASEAFGIAARLRAVEKYPWSRTASDYLEIFEQVVHG